MAFVNMDEETGFLFTFPKSQKYLALSDYEC